jgi:oligogalacturonide transporter
MATFIRKIATGLSSAVIGILLAIVGYNEELANEGLRQTAATQHGVALIYVFAPVVLMVLTLILVFKFPLGKKEFGVVQRDLARRKGENKTIATEEERYILERVTGFTYEALWNIDNARGFEKTGKA